MNALIAIGAIGLATFKGGIRDRLIQSLLLAGLFFLISTVVFSSFSMRQTLEVAVNYSLATVQILTILITLFLGLNLVSREIETRTGYGVLSQPLSRSHYLLGKFVGLALLCAVVVVFLTGCALVGIVLVQLGEPEAQIHWLNIAVAVGGILMVALLLQATSILLFAVATSAVLPFLATIGVWLIGESTQTVKNYLEANIATQEMTTSLKAITTGAYYLFPNLSLLDFKVYAIYGLPLSAGQIGFSVVYGLLYTAVLLALATRLFQTRDMT